MRVRFQNDLLLLSIVTVLLIPIIIFLPSSTLRIVLGMPFLLLFPGYTLTAVLFPRRNALDAIERAALSFGLSIVVVSLIGLILNYTPWGIKLYPTLISLAILILVFVIAAWYRRQRLAEAERFTVSFHLNLAPWRGQCLVDRILSVILIATILGAAGTLGYVIAAPEIGEKFTEFYILGPEGKAIDYPREMRVGAQERVFVGIISREHEKVSYSVEVIINGAKYSEIGPVVLENDSKWEQEIDFILVQAGDNQKVEFLLYKQKQSEVYRATHLWVNVKE